MVIRDRAVAVPRVHWSWAFFVPYHPFCVLPGDEVTFLPLDRRCGRVLARGRR